MMFDEESDVEHEVTITLTEEFRDGIEVDHTFTYIIGVKDIFQTVRHIDDTEQNLYPLKPYAHPDLVRWVISDIDRRMMQRGYTMSDADLKEIMGHFK
jgi:hypothetical protein